MNASRMGVPQARERTFFIARKADLKLDKLSLSFEEPVVAVAKAFNGLEQEVGKPLSEKAAIWWDQTSFGGLFSVCGADTGKMNRKLDPNKPSWTQTATPNIFHWLTPRHLSNAECVRVQSFPDDYSFIKQKHQKPRFCHVGH